MKWMWHGGAEPSGWRPSTLRRFLVGVLAAMWVAILVSACQAVFEDSGTEWSGTIDGTEWGVTATFEEADGLLCLRRWAGSRVSFSCVQPVLGSQVLDVEGASEDDSLPIAVIAGQVAPSVTEVRVKLADGALRVLELRDLSGTDRRVFVAALSGDAEPQIVEAETRDGNIRSYGL